MLLRWSLVVIFLVGCGSAPSAPTPVSKPAVPTLQELTGKLIGEWSSDKSGLYFDETRRCFGFSLVDRTIGPDEYWEPVRNVGNILVLKITRGKGKPRYLGCKFEGAQMIVLLLDHEYDTDNFWGTPMNRSHITDDMVESQKKQ